MKQQIMRNWGTQPEFVTQKEAWENLSNAVVLQAVEDYLYLKTSGKVQYGDDKDTIEYVVLFFKSQWFSFLCSIPDETILEYCEKIIKDWSANK